METSIASLTNFDLIGREKVEDITGRITPASINPAYNATISEVNNRPTVR